MAITHSTVLINTGQTIDNTTVSGNQRQVTNLGGPDSGDVNAIAAVQATQPTGTEQGLVVREAQKGQTTSANSRPVVLASDQSSIPVTGSFFQTTQPISGTVTANAGSGTFAVSATSLPLPSGAATSSKQPLLGVAGTPSTDVISIQGVASGTVVPISGTISGTGNFTVVQPTAANLNATIAGTVSVSNFPATQPVSGTVGINNFPATQAISGTVAVTQSTSPWVVTGSKTTNSTAPSTNNDSSLISLANAATPSFTEGNLIFASSDLGGSLRTTARAPQALGYYSVGTVTGIYNGLAAGAPLFSMRWGDATRLCLILKVSVSVVATAAATVAGPVDRQLIVARSFTVADSGGTAISLTGNQQKHRTSQATSLVSDMRIATTAALTAGTRTLDGVGVGIAAAGMSSGLLTVMVNVTLIPKVDLFSAYAGEIMYPLVLAQNEGIIVRMVNAQPTGSSLLTYVDVTWAEVNSY